MMGDVGRLARSALLVGLVTLPGACGAREELGVAEADPCRLDHELGVASDSCKLELAGPPIDLEKRL